MCDQNLTPSGAVLRQHEYFFRAQMPGSEHASGAHDQVRDLGRFRNKPAIRIENRDPAGVSMAPAVIGGAAGRHPDLPGAELQGEPDRRRVQSADSGIQDNAAIYVNPRNDPRNEVGPLNR